MFFSLHFYKACALLLPLSDLAASLRMCAGEMEVTLRSISAGGLASPDAPLVSTILQSPSAQCNQLLRIADLQSVAIREESFVPEDAASCSHASSSVFLVGKLGYKPGEIQQPTSVQPPFPMQGQDDDADAQKQAMLRPPGLRVQVQIAHCFHSCRYS